MVPVAFTNYFIASVGASAALIGLLFVAVTVAPERIFGQDRKARDLVLASSAFMALLDAFFISLVALIPGTNLGYVAVLMGGLALLNTLSLGRHLWVDRNHTPFTQVVTLLVGGIVIYVYEMGFGVALLRSDRDTQAVTGLTYLLLGSYGLGVARTWKLLGGEREAFLSLLGFVGVGADGPSTAPAEPHAGGGDAAPLPQRVKNQAPEDTRA